MKKILVVIFFLLFSVQLGSCNQSEEIIESQPIGYGLLSNDYIGSLEILYVSDIPNNINNFTLTPYYLPHVWAELEVNEENEIAEYILINEKTSGTKYYAKYLLIGSVSFVAEIDSGTVRYLNQDQINLIEILENEDQAKWYIEQIEQYQIMMTNEQGAIIDEKSVYDLSPFYPYQRAEENGHTWLMNWVGTLEELPRFPSLYPELQTEYGFNTQRLNDLIERAYNQRNNAEYITTRRNR
ncbi:hypothetical protein [Peloplasma aerotolerans]|uniref:DUF3997 domain-containing protein n=1 Tax=Peloplasma aerotolerans TaxID=3044389 RepID=A0AAW6U5Z9_9MOLU|nr:hypothetical protein [Mariniplasma sp. M4Ah]MDI6453322.1 hypothetical protein [Mariniplasma sp. M4Ah]MDR4968127.1 hypothetical protein [Acholeplasmataceae bacterium]